MRANAMSGAPTAAAPSSYRETHERRHDRPEHHDEAVHRGELVEELRLKDLQPGLNSSARMPTPACRRP